MIKEIFKKYVIFMYLARWFSIMFFLQFNNTPLELAVMGNHSDTVCYFINELKMDSTIFDKVAVAH